tara:strand:- start:1387 stop:1521 length:135 start_codon:yes stop_codon:yes gene_type:complete
MKIKEVIQTPDQKKKPQSPGARGITLHSTRAGKRWFDLSDTKKQ